MDFDVQVNEDSLRKDLDLLEERRDMAIIHLASYQQRIKRGHDKNVRARVFWTGDLVLRRVMTNIRKASDGKLGAKLGRTVQSGLTCRTRSL